MKDNQTYINLNYDKRKAVINLSLSQLKSITGSDEDLRNYPRIFAHNMFMDSDSDSPRKLKVQVFLNGEYDKNLQEASENIKKELAVYEEKMSSLEDEMQSLTEQNQSLQNKIDEDKILIEGLKKDKQYLLEQKDSLQNDIEQESLKSQSLSENLDKLKDAKFYEYMIKKDNLNKTLNSIYYLGRWSLIKGEHKKIIEKVFDDIHREESILSLVDNKK